MTHKLSRCAALLFVFAAAPACASSTESTEPTDPAADGENLGQIQQGLCAYQVTSMPPVVVGQIIGTGNEVSSGTYDYGNGPCSGWVVKLTGLGYSSSGQRISVKPGEILTEHEECSTVTLQLWVWSRPAGSSEPWTYRGSDAGGIRLRNQAGHCRGMVSVWVPGPGNLEVIAKVQSRSERSVPWQNGTISYAFNRPVAAYAQ